LISALHEPHLPAFSAQLDRPPELPEPGAPHPATTSPSSTATA
jgi:hypothetical protein